MSNILVMGMGKSGIAACRLLESQNNKVFVYDDNDKYNSYQKYDDKTNIDLVIVSPSICSDHELLKKFRRKNIKIISELQLGLNNLQAAYIAITGTNGKTTTTLLVNEILNEAGLTSVAIGNIGEPVCNYADILKPNEYAVVEVSSFQLENTRMTNPIIVALTNISPDHIDRHKNYQEYITTKLSIFENLSKPCRVVLNYDDVILRELSQSIDLPINYYSYDTKVNGSYIEDNYIFYNEQNIISIADIAMKHKFNYYNAMCAVAITLPMGIHKETIAQVLRRFIPPEYRMAYRGKYFNKEFYNDSKATNIYATLVACNSMNKDTVLIMGGSDKGEEFDYLFENLPEYIKYILVTGDNALKIIDSAHKYGYINIFQEKSLFKCIEHAKTLNVDCVLFSPASASFDKYNDYMERGAYFDCLL